MLNKFPYTSGHLLIAPLRHIGNYTEMNDDELNEISLTIRDCIAALETAFGPQGYNIGVNVGNVAGAGVPGHIHWHIVPRWAGDKNFMYVTGETNVISFSNEEIFKKLSIII
jgi:ATP adenylyltransferase